MRSPSSSTKRMQSWPPSPAHVILTKSFAAGVRRAGDADFFRAGDAGFFRAGDADFFRAGDADFADVFRADLRGGIHPLRGGCTLSLFLRCRCRCRCLLCH